MSYILEALKKAERERSRAKVPTLTTVHIPVYVRRRRVALWAVAVACLSGGLVVWLLRPSPPGSVTGPVQSRPSVEVAPSADVTNPTGPPAPARGAIPPAAPMAPAHSPVPTAGRDLPQEPDRQASPRPAAKPDVRQVPESGGQPFGPGPRETAHPEATPIPPLPRVETPRRVEGGEVRSGAAGTASPPAPANTPMLRDVLPKMTLDMFVYTDVEADRAAVINGRRYIKGQRVDGLYLVEDITPEGVVLSYQGEKAVLRP